MTHLYSREEVRVGIADPAVLGWLHPAAGHWSALVVVVGERCKEHDADDGVQRGARSITSPRAAGPQRGVGRTRPSEGDRTIGTGIEDERNPVAVDGATETARLLDEPGRDLDRVGGGLEVVGEEQLGLRSDEGGAGDLDHGFEEGESGELGRDTEARDGWREGGGSGRFADVQPCGSRRDGPSMRTV